MNNLNTLDLEYEVACYCIKTGKVECSDIQKHFGLGYNSTQKIMNELEKKKVLSEQEGLGKRSILVNQDILDQIFMESNQKRKQFLQEQEQQIADLIPSDNREILLKYDLWNDVIKTIRLKGLIQLDRSDFADVLNYGTIFGYSKEIFSINETPKITEIHQPSKSIKIIISMISGETKYNLFLDVVRFYRSKYPEADIVFGVSLEESLAGQIDLLALMTCK